MNLLEETVLRSSSNFDVHPGIEEFLKSRYWIKLKSSFAILASALSVEIGNGNALQEFSPANAFNGELDQYFLSSCEEGFPTWVEQDFRTPKQVCGIGVHGNDRTLFPHTWKLQGAPHADAKTFEDIISIEEDGFFSACNKSTNECDSIGSTYHNIQPCVSYRHYRFLVSRVNDEKQKCVQINNIAFYDIKSQIIPLGPNTGKIQIGVYEHDTNKILLSENVPVLSNIDSISFKTESNDVTGILDELCVPGMSIPQGSQHLFTKDLFVIGQNTGVLSVKNDVVGGDHGTLDFEYLNSFGMIIKVTDKNTNYAFVDIIVHLQDVNEPPMFISSCSKDPSLLACPTISEHSMSYNVGSTAGMVYPYNSMYRLHYPSECIFNGSASLGENSLLLLETKNANATWRFFSSQNEEKIFN